jgi:hypothetical protein
MQKDFKLLAIIGLSAAAASCAHSPANNLAKPNIIFIMADDHVWQAISA